MFREMRKKQRELDKDNLERILNEGEYGVLATLSENGYPYATPISYVYIDRNIYVHCATEGQKLDNIKKHEKVSFTVVGNTKVIPEKFSTMYESVIAFGKASVCDGEEKVKALEAFIKKYSPDFWEEGKAYINRALEVVCIIKIDVEKATAKGRLE